MSASHFGYPTTTSSVPHDTIGIDATVESISSLPHTHTPNAGARVDLNAITDDGTFGTNNSQAECDVLVSR